MQICNGVKIREGVGLRNGQVVAFIPEGDRYRSATGATFGEACRNLRIKMAGSLAGRLGERMGESTALIERRREFAEHMTRQVELKVPRFGEGNLLLREDGYPHATGAR